MADVRAAYERAAGAWTEADWLHEAPPDGTPSAGPHEGCGICLDAARDAGEAQEEGHAALKLAEAGKWPAAVERARQAAGYERPFGDTWTWGPFLRAVEAAAGAAPLAAFYDVAQEVEDLDALIALLRVPGVARLLAEREDDALPLPVFGPGRGDGGGSEEVLSWDATRRVVLRRDPEGRLQDAWIDVEEVERPWPLRSATPAWTSERPPAPSREANS